MYGKVLLSKVDDTPVQQQSPAFSDLPLTRYQQFGPSVVARDFQACPARGSARAELLSGCLVRLHEAIGKHGVVALRVLAFERTDIALFRFAARPRLAALILSDTLLVDAVSCCVDGQT